MKLSIKAGLALTGLLALFSFIMSALLVQALPGKTPPASGSNGIRYHLALYLPKNRNSGETEIIAGAQKAASEIGAALSVHYMHAAGAELRMAAYLNVDGIVVCPDLDDSLTLPQLVRLRDMKIPIVLINHNIPSDQPWPFIGTNNFDLGKKAGTLVGIDGVTDIQLAVVYSDKAPAIFAERELFEMGINSVLGQKSASPILSQRTDMNPRDAEKIVYALVRSQPRLSTIVFTDVEDTIAGTQALIDLNLVGQIQIVGVGSDPLIREYIQKGIVKGTLVLNPALIGYQAVKSLAELRDTGYTSTSVDTGINVLVQETP